MCVVPERVSGCLFGCNCKERVMRELDALMLASSPRHDPMMERLSQCPEAFQVGEMLAKLFDSQQFNNDQERSERLLPPSGTVIPPLV